jgi:hypothetical protein
LKKPTEITQIVLIAFTLLFFGWDATLANYTSFLASPPNVSDKIWYLGESILFLLFSLNFVKLNRELKEKYYSQSWGLLAFFFLIRTIWTILWITLGLSANMSIAQTVIFSIVLSSIFCITFLPYIRRTTKGTK